MKHGDIKQGFVHVPYNWWFANETARTGYLGLTFEDIGKLAFQADTKELWQLISVTPTIEWKRVLMGEDYYNKSEIDAKDSAIQADLNNHKGDATIHFKQSDISITESQISDLDKYTKSEVDGKVTNLQTQIANNDSDISSLQTQVSINDTDISNIQTDLSNHKNDSDIHFTQSQISITESQVSDLDKYTQSEVDTKLSTKANTNTQNTFTEMQTFTNPHAIRLNIPDGFTGVIDVYRNGQLLGYIGTPTTGNDDMYILGANNINLYTDGTIKRKGTYQIWDSGNDGSGSGLDADKLDGLESEQFVRQENLDVNHGAHAEPIYYGKYFIGRNTDYKPFLILFSKKYNGTLLEKQGVMGTLYFSRGSQYSSNYSWKADIVCTTAYDNNYNYLLYNRAYSLKLVEVDYNGETWYGLYYPSVRTMAITFVGYKFSDWIFIPDATDYIVTYITAEDTYNNGNKVWHSGNDGSGSGLDADKLDGVEGSSFVRNDDPNTQMPPHHYTKFYASDGTYGNNYINLFPYNYTGTLKSRTQIRACDGTNHYAVCDIYPDKVVFSARPQWGNNTLTPYLEQADEPNGAENGTLWYDTTNNVVKIKTSNGWKTIT